MKQKLKGAEEIKTKKEIEEYWKITQLKEYLLTLGKEGILKCDVTRSEGSDVVIKIKLMQEAQEFGYEVGVCKSTYPLAYQKGRQEVIEMIDKQKWDKNKCATTNQIATKMVEYSGGINSVIDRHNKSLEELKQKLKGDEK